MANRLLDLVDIAGYDIVGLGVIAGEQILATLLLAEKIKQEYKVPVVIGGPYVTSFGDLFFKKYNFIDYAIAGEGEIPLLKLLHFIEGKEKIQNVPSLWYRNNSQVIFNGRSFFNIENQSCPDFDGLPLEFYEKHGPRERFLVIPYSISRGCIYRCSFCLYHNIDGPWQCKSIEKVTKEIISLKEKYGSRFFHFRDANFNISYEHVDKLCDAFIKKNVNIYWSALVRANNLDRKLLFKMKKAGCFALVWGIESGSDRILKLMRKDADIENQIKILKMAKEVGINNRVGLITEYPYETADDLKKTALLIKNNAKLIDSIDFFKLLIYRGSFLFNNAEEVKIELKESKNSFFTYYYDYEEVGGNSSPTERRVLKKLWRKIISYHFKYIESKHFRFPFNIIMKFFGVKLQKIHNFIKKLLLKH